MASPRRWLDGYAIWTRGVITGVFVGLLLAGYFELFSHGAILVPCLIYAAGAAVLYGLITTWQERRLDARDGYRPPHCHLGRGRHRRTSGRVGSSDQHAP